MILSQSYNQPMDPLSDVLSLLKPRTYVTGGLSAGGQWSLQIPAHPGIKCYAVVKGECWLSMEDIDEPFHLRSGNCVLLPHGRSFVLASDLTMSPMDARQLISKVERYQGVVSVNPGDDFLVLGSHFALEGDAHFLLDVLPPVVMLENEPHNRSPTLCWSKHSGCISQLNSKTEPGGFLLLPMSACERHFLPSMRLPLMPGHWNSSPRLSGCPEPPSPRHSGRQ